MSTKKKTSYIQEELAWLEERVKQIKSDVDANPYDKIKDRKITLSAPSGSKEAVAATKEVQKKALREALKEYAQLLEMVDKLREKEETKIEARGKTELTPDQERWLREKK